MWNDISSGSIHTTWVILNLAIGNQWLLGRRLSYLQWCGPWVVIYVPDDGHISTHMQTPLNRHKVLKITIIREHKNLGGNSDEGEMRSEHNKKKVRIKFSINKKEAMDYIKEKDDDMLSMLWFSWCRIIYVHIMYIHLFYDYRYNFPKTQINGKEPNLDFAKIVLASLVHTTEIHRNSWNQKGRKLFSSVHQCWYKRQTNIICQRKAVA